MCSTTLLFEKNNICNSIILYIDDLTFVSIHSPLLMVSAVLSLQFRCHFIYTGIKGSEIFGEKSVFATQKSFESKLNFCICFWLVSFVLCYI